MILLNAILVKKSCRFETQLRIMHLFDVKIVISIKKSHNWGVIIKKRMKLSSTLFFQRGMNLHNLRGQNIITLFQLNIMIFLSLQK